jgi:hypothetical protein
MRERMAQIPCTRQKRKREGKYAEKKESQGADSASKLGDGDTRQYEN